MIRSEPTMEATGLRAHICAAGSPDFSNSLTSTAPQRVLLPQVEVRMTPETPSCFNCRAMACPIFLEFSRIPTAPVVA